MALWKRLETNCRRGRSKSDRTPLRRIQFSACSGCATLPAGMCVFADMPGFEPFLCSRCPIVIQLVVQCVALVSTMRVQESNWQPIRRCRVRGVSKCHPSCCPAFSTFSALISAATSCPWPMEGSYSTAEAHTRLAHSNRRGEIRIEIHPTSEKPLLVFKTP